MKPTTEATTAEQPAISPKPPKSPAEIKEETLALSQWFVAKQRERISKAQIPLS